MSDNCLFCQIIAKKIPADIVYEDDSVLGFKDINPQAPVHILFIPKRHVASLDSVDSSGASMLSSLIQAVQKTAAKQGIKGAYRVVSNVGKEAGQSVFHLHFHLLGGRPMTWPPG